jgi:hypothetical protein
MLSILYEEIKAFKLAVLLVELSYRAAYVVTAGGDRFTGTALTNAET